MRADSEQRRGRLNISFLTNFSNDKAHDDDFKGDYLRTDAGSGLYARLHSVSNYGQYRGKCVYLFPLKL